MNRISRVLGDMYIDSIKVFGTALCSLPMGTFGIPRSPSRKLLSEGDVV